MTINVPFPFKRVILRGMKINVVLFQPEIPQNTGKISRTCSATGSALHLVHPLGFSLDERHLRRAGLDYWRGLEIHEYQDNSAFFEEHGNERIWYFSQKGKTGFWEADVLYDEPENDKEKSVWLAFGCESRGLDEKLLLKNASTCARIPMLEGKRSLNLSNTVAVAVYEVLRRLNFAGLRTTGELSCRDWSEADA